MIEHCLAIALHLNGLSHHFGAGDYNERNYGAGVSCEYERGRRWSAGWFRDSYDNGTSYVGHEWDVVSVKNMRLGVMAGVANHTKHKGLFAAPYASVQSGPVEVRGYAMPSLNQTPATVAAQLRIHF